MPRTLDHAVQLPYLNYDKTPELKWLYVVRVARSIANRLAFFYIPLFIYQLGATKYLFFGESAFQSGMLLVFLFYLLNRVVTLLSFSFSGNSIARLGLGKSMMFGNLVYAVYAGLLHLSSTSLWFLFIAALLNGLQTHYFWVSYHTFLSNKAKESHLGADVGLVQILINLFQLVSPVVGGLIVVNFGYSALFLLGMVIVLLGAIASLFLDSEPIRDRVSLKELKRWLAEKRFLRLAVSFSGQYFNDSATTLWPLYVMLILDSPDKVGYLYSFSLFLALIVSYVIGGRKTSKKDKQKMVFSGGLLSILWLVRSLVFTVWSIAIVDAVDKLTANAHWLMFDRAWLIRGRGSQALSYFVYREVIVSIGSIVFWLLVILLFLGFKMNWYGLFILGAVGSMMTMTINDNKLDY